MIQKKFAIFTPTWGDAKESTVHSSTFQSQDRNRLIKRMFALSFLSEENALAVPNAISCMSKKYQNHLNFKFVSSSPSLVPAEPIIVRYSMKFIPRKPHPNQRRILSSPHPILSLQSANFALISRSLVAAIA
jgi:hypothetical protein